LGKNSRNYSFLVGFDDRGPGMAASGGAASKPHHRNVYLNDNNVEVKNTLSIPARNKYFGYMVGGHREPNKYEDNVDKYESTEGGLDYQAGFVGVLAYIISKLAPADTSKFGKTPVIPQAAEIRISTSPNPGETSAFVGDTVPTGNSSYPDFYAHVFNDDGTAISNQCDDVTWKINGNFYATGCAFRDTLIRCAAIGCIRYTLTAEFVPSSGGQPLTASVFVSDGGVSVLPRNASIAKNGYAINIRPGSVVFRAAEGRAITKLNVINLNGRKVFSKAGSYSEINWDSAVRPKGMYVVKMTMSNGAVVQRNLLLK
jgi:hypothetical protein